ncbi:MAG: gluconate 2-dehydrogenase subunit 3 family protein, partial [Verrucomicrobiia bacterium]
MSIQENSTRATRRAAITWMLTASSTIPFLNGDTPPEGLIAHDPKVNIPKKNLWDRTLNKSQLPLVATLTDIILPSANGKPSASDLNIPDFIDEWISAPYALQQKDRIVILAGLKWIKKESRKRFKKGFTKLSQTHQAAICIDISNPITAKPTYESAAAFFLLFR